MRQIDFLPKAAIFKIFFDFYRHSLLHVKPFHHELNNIHNRIYNKTLDCDWFSARLFDM